MIIKYINRSLVKSFPNRTGASRSHATWKWKHMLRKMVIPGERIAEVESEDTGDTGSVEPYPDISAMGIPGILSSDLCIPSPLHTRAYGKARKTKKDREPYVVVQCIFQKI